MLFQICFEPVKAVFGETVAFDLGNLTNVYISYVWYRATVKFSLPFSTAHNKINKACTTIIYASN